MINCPLQLLYVHKHPLWLQIAFSVVKYKRYF